VCCGVAAAIGLVGYLVSSSRPPGEAKLIQGFRAHRAQFERLRDMLQADSQLVRLAAWGVQTTNSVLPCLPPKGSFPVSRYNEYLDLLKHVGGSAVSRGEGRDANPNILLWASGFAGETRHIGLSWMDSRRPLLTPAPARQPFLATAPTVADGLGRQVSLSKAWARSRVRKPSRSQVER
jgi:hypothetical protein